MKIAVPVIGIIVLSIVVFFGVPMVAQGTGNVCQALEKQAVTNEAANMAGGRHSGAVFNTINTVGQNGATGQVASGLMQQQHPSAPTPVACTWFYWKSILS